MTYRAALGDALLIAAAYAAALVVRVGARPQLAFPDVALPFVAVVALLQVLLTVLAGGYRSGRTIAWPRDVAVLGVPALAAAGIVTAFDLLSPIHPIPYGAVPTAALLSLALVAGARLRERLPILARLAFSRDLAEASSLPLPSRPDVEATIVPPDGTIRDAIVAIDRDVSRIALVADAQRVLLGTITDGDVRRALLAGKDLATPAVEIMRTRPVVASIGATDGELVALMRRHVVRQIPLLDDRRRVIDLRIGDGPVAQARERAPVLIMAGGRGLRLGELARTIPKPLVRVAGRPILETLVRDLASQGFTRVVLAVAYRSEQIERHFGDGSAFGVEIEYVREDTPLGTAGAIRIVAPTVGGPLLVTNADVLTRLSFVDLLDLHTTEGNDLTIGAITSTQQLRYGLLETDGTRVVALREKPALRHLVNAGIYVVEPACAPLIPADMRFDMDALIAAALGASLRVGCFPIHEYWADVGVPADLERATREYPAELARVRR